MSNVRDFGAVGDGRSDETEALQHALADGDGVLEFPRGEYRITRTLVADLARHGRTSLVGHGVARVIMEGPGPAVLLLGTHAGSADPFSFQPDVWQHQRMPQLSGLEIEGRHAEADGVRIEGVMQPTLMGVLIRRVRTAVHVTRRARNLLINHCHIYHNTGIGVHFDRCNLHQAIIVGSHISYCRRGGVRVEGSEIRNFQITGSDIEYNNNRAHQEQFPDDDSLPTAEIYIDVQDGTVREGTIAGNTIQATASPGGANIRFIGRGGDINHKAGMWTISGNLIGSQTDNIHLTSVRGVTITGNYIYSGHHRNLLVEDSRNIVVGANCFGHNPDYGEKELCTGVRFVDCDAVVLSGTIIEDCRAGQHTVAGVQPVERQGLLELVRCRSVTIDGVQVHYGAPHGMYLEDCRDTLISGCTILDGRDPPLMQTAIRWAGAGGGNLITGCRLGTGTAGAVEAPEPVRQSGNLTDE